MLGFPGLGVMMDKNEKNEKEKNDDPQPESDSSNNDIPLWLQGLENNETEEPESFASKKDVKSSWVPELNNETTEHDQNKGAEEINSTSEPIDQQAHDQETIDFESMESDSTEEIQIDKLPNGEDAAEIGPSLDDLPTSEGFMDISEMELSETAEEKEPVLDDDTLIEGDLPEWLQEMIAEQEESKTSEADPESVQNQAQVEISTSSQVLDDHDEVFTKDQEIEEDELIAEDAFIEEKEELVQDDELVVEDEPISEDEPVIEDEVIHDDELISEEEPVMEDRFIQEDELISEDEPFVEEEFIHEDDLISEGEPKLEEQYIIESDYPFDLEAAEAISEDDTVPTTVSKDVEMEEDSPTEPAIDEAQQVIENAEILEQAKLYIDQGDFYQGLPFIKELVSESSHLEKLELWIIEAVEGEAKANSDVWEVLGDISLKSNKNDQALTAYAKAIKYLLVTDEVTDENS